MTYPTPNPTKKFDQLETDVMFHKATERPNTNKYDHFFEAGLYVCKNCAAPLYSSEFKFDSGCGWPAFDDEIKGAIRREKDKDTYRTEILCNNCGIHLGHIFTGERATVKNLRHCVNSASMDFIDENEMNSDSRFQIAVVAAGCFWGVQTLFNKLGGVVTTQVGYTGGDTIDPTYKQICNGDTGHLEAIKVVFDSTIVSYQSVIKYFFEIHDFEQTDGQGNDRGSQYLSAIICQDEIQKEVARSVVQILTDKGYTVATKLLPKSVFYKGEEYHQDYYAKNGHQPYCHFYKKIF
jgi:peptide methionine sulfoxide reductase msrA/msrB